MKNKTIIFAAILLPLILLTGCMNISKTYDNADKYTAGNRDITDSISVLNINWSCGSVTVARGSGDSITVRETCKVSLDSEKQVHTWVDGDTLRVQFSASGEVLRGEECDKKLEILVPEGQKFSGIKCEASSADIRISEQLCDELTVDTSSGDIRAEDCATPKISMTASSGDINVMQKAECDLIKCSTSSGEIGVTAETVKELRTDASSGGITCNIASADSVYADTSSGEIKLTFGAVPASTKITASSGDVKVSLPKDPDFKAEISTSSGDFNYTGISLSKSGESYSCGSGTNSISVETSSGDITFNAGN